MDLKDLKLTEQEEKTLFTFVGRAVIKNAKFPLLSNRVGSSSYVTIQEIVNSSEETIRNMGKFLNKLINESDSEFDEDSKEVSFSGIKAVELKENLKLILKLKKYKNEISKARKLKSQLMLERDALKTPEERKQELDKELKELELISLED